MSAITEDDLKSAEGYEVLGPAYFAARRIAEKVMQGADVEPLQKIAEKVADDIRQAMYEYVEDHMRSDLEINLQGHLCNLVDDTVKALLTGQQWALNRYPLSQRYDAVEVREACAKHGGEPLLMARIADLEKEVARLNESLKWEREWRR